MRSLWWAAAIAVALSASAANAGSACCASPPFYGPPPVGYAPESVYSPIYVVDQGPVFSGPGIYTLPTIADETVSVAYPYVGRRYGYYRRYGAPYVGHYWHRPRAAMRRHRVPPGAKVIVVPPQGH